MLISLTLENWMSFRDTASFSAVATRERQHGERVTKLDKYQTRVVPIAAIYGGNGSGKTNFFKALNFAKAFVVSGSQPDALIPVEPFRLSDDTADKPSRFTFELLAEERIYEYSFALTKTEVVEEKLIVIQPSSEKPLFHRLNGRSNLHKSLANQDFLQFAFRGTRDNQLFLTNSVSQKGETFRAVYDWFKESLELIAPDARFDSVDFFVGEDHPLFAAMNQVLPQLDIGISRIALEEVPIDSIHLPESALTKLNQTVKEGTTVRLLSAPEAERCFVSRQGGKLTATKAVAYHSTAGGDLVKFAIEMESDGARRIIDLLPLLLTLTSPPGQHKVFVIDEIDRSLHTLLTRTLLEFYLGQCTPTSRSQLLFTTHDVQLMDQQLFRRDEMWIAERDFSGATSLLPFSDYKDMRYDKDIRKSYLSGRLGGIPKVGALSHTNLAKSIVEDDG